MRTLTLPIALLSVLALQSKSAHADDAASEPPPPEPTPVADPAPTPPPEKPPEAPKPAVVASEPAPPPRAQETDDLNPNKLATVALGGAGAILLLGAFSYEIEANASLALANRNDDAMARTALRKDASHQHLVAAAMGGGAVLSIAGSVLMYMHYRSEKEAAKKVSFAPVLNENGGGFVVGGWF